MENDITYGFNVFWAEKENTLRVHSGAFRTSMMAKPNFGEPRPVDDEYLVRVTGTSVNQAKEDTKTILNNYFIKINKPDLAELVLLATEFNASIYDGIKGAIYGPLGAHKFIRE